jgi:3-phenylpropionate/trans-cinnamate dioxygenase ferredoxin subunit
MTRHVVAKVEDLVEGRSKRVTIAGRAIALFNVKGTFFALSDKCPHENGSLSCGRIIGLAEADEPGKYRLTRQGEFVKCPWHGWEFDIRTGQSWCDPTKTRTRTFPANVASGAEIAKGPYVAETFSVSIEANYIVIDL